MKTPMQEHIEWLEKEYKKFDAEDNVAYWFHNRGIRQAIDHAESLLEKEEEVMSVSKRFSSAEKMAEWLHNNYEEIALNNGWKTQEDCQVPFCDLPKENKQTMIELCERLLNVC